MPKAAHCPIPPIPLPTGLRRRRLLLLLLQLPRHGLLTVAAHARLTASKPVVHARGLPVKVPARTDSSAESVGAITAARRVCA